MFVKMDKIDIYNDSAIILKRNTPKSVISWITILFILLVLLIIFLFIPFNIYKYYEGYVKLDNNKSYIVFPLKTGDFPINNKNKIYIKGEKYDYHIIDINVDRVVLKVDLVDEIKIENNIIIANVLRDRTTLFKILKNKIKKGFGL